MRGQVGLVTGVILLSLLVFDTVVEGLKGSLSFPGALRLRLKLGPGDISDPKMQSPCKSISGGTSDRGVEPIDRCSPMLLR